MSQKKENMDKAGQFRRKILKTTAAGLLACAVLPFFGARSAVAAPAAGADTDSKAGKEDKKILIVYYSRSGNTRTIAQQIQQQLGGDLLELEPVTPYPDEYRATTEQAKKELESAYNPPLKTRFENVKAYDLVFVGSPNWWGTVAGPVRTFLAGADLAGKRIAPFITHEGSGLGRSVEDIKKFCPKADVLKGLAVRGSRVREARADVAGWLRSLGLGK